MDIMDAHRKRLSLAEQAFMEACLAHSKKMREALEELASEVLASEVKMELEIEARLRAFRGEGGGTITLPISPDPALEVVQPEFIPAREDRRAKVLPPQTSSP